MHLWALPGFLGERQGFVSTEKKAQGWSLKDWEWGRWALTTQARTAYWSARSLREYMETPAIPISPPTSQVRKLRPGLSAPQQMPVTPLPPHPTPLDSPSGLAGS